MVLIPWRLTRFKFQKTKVVNNFLKQKLDLLNRNNAIFGQELKSFNQKRGSWQSGVNSIQTMFVVELPFALSKDHRIVD